MLTFSQVEVCLHVSVHRSIDVQVAIDGKTHKLFKGVSFSRDEARDE